MNLGVKNTGPHRPAGEYFNLILTFLFSFCIDEASVHILDSTVGHPMPIHPGCLKSGGVAMSNLAEICPIFVSFLQCFNRFSLLHLQFQDIAPPISEQEVSHSTQSLGRLTSALGKTRDSDFSQNR